MHKEYTCVRAPSQHWFQNFSGSTGQAELSWALPEETLGSQKSLSSPSAAHVEAVLISKRCGFLSYLKVTKHVIIIWKKRLKIPFPFSFSPYYLYFSFSSVLVCVCVFKIFEGQGNLWGFFNQSGYSFNALEICIFLSTFISVFSGSWEEEKRRGTAVAC